MFLFWDVHVCAFRYDNNQLIGHNINLLIPPPFSEHHTTYVRAYITTGATKHTHTHNFWFWIWGVVCPGNVCSTTRLGYEWKFWRRVCCKLPVLVKIVACRADCWEVRTNNERLCCQAPIINESASAHNKSEIYSQWDVKRTTARTTLLCFNQAHKMKKKEPVHTAPSVLFSETFALLSFPP